VEAEVTQCQAVWVGRRLQHSGRSNNCCPANPARDSLPTVAPHEHRVGLRVGLNRRAHAVGQLALARRVFDDRHDAVAVEAMVFNALRACVV
jgi:hypothetical protein